MGCTPSINRSEFSSKYELTGRTLGTGHFGKVLEALPIANCNFSTHGKVAVKVISKVSEFNSVYEDQAVVFREVAILKDLHHKYILRLYDFYEESDRFLLVLEYAGGKDLLDRVVAKVNYSEADARDLFQCLVRAVQYIHNHDVVHRDLKLENVLMKSETDDIDIRIGDFGLATYCIGDLILDQAGTPRYIAPEVVRGVPYGKRVDVWALGVILYILLSGQFPFDEIRRGTLFCKIKAGAYTFDHEHWTDVHEEAQDLIRNILQTDPTQRFTLEEILACPWMTSSGDDLSSRLLVRSQQSMEFLKDSYRHLSYKQDSASSDLAEHFPIKFNSMNVHFEEDLE